MDDPEPFEPFDPFGIIRPHRRVVTLGAWAFIWPLKWSWSGYALMALWTAVTVAAWNKAEHAYVITYTDPTFSALANAAHGKVSFIYGAPIMGVLGLCIAFARLFFPLGVVNRWAWPWSSTPHARWMESEAVAALINTAWFGVIYLATQLQAHAAIAAAISPR